MPLFSLKTLRYYFILIVRAEIYYKIEAVIIKMNKTKTIAIMQPYFLPYIGYWQLMNIVDEFIVYDNIKYTKKGWINRNRYLCGGEDKFFTIQLKKDSDFLDVRERELSPVFDKDKILHQIKEAYKKAPFFKPIYELFEDIILCNEKNLFDYIFYSIKTVAKHLDIKTKIIISSHINIDHSLKSEKKVIEICKKLEADRYINPIGGVELYDKTEFNNYNIKLEFIKVEVISYEQAGNLFIPFLSILDVLMFNGTDKTKKMLEAYNLE